jgi:hypothetical protein
VGECEPTYTYPSTSLSERRKDDINGYNKYRSDRTVVIGNDDSIYFYLISARWMGIWRKFVNGETSQPGCIANKLLAARIMKMRGVSGHLAHDNEVKLRE